MLRLALLISPLLLSGCILGTGECSYEIRSLVMAGSLTGTGQPTGEAPLQAELALNESRDGVDYRILTISIQGGSVHGITAVDVVGGSGAGAILLASFTQGNTTTPGYWHSDLGYTTPAPSHTQLKWYAAQGELRLIARYSGGGTAEGTLRITSDGDWNHPNCS
jgi:hypothetical protein